MPKIPIQHDPKHCQHLYQKLLRFDEPDFTVQENLKLLSPDKVAMHGVRRHEILSRIKTQVMRVLLGVESQFPADACDPSLGLLFLRVGALFLQNVRWHAVLAWSSAPCLEEYYASRF